LNLQDKIIVITAGPTYEKIDPVRFIGNHSSGKMGFSLAKVCLDKGAKVILITGPTQQEIDSSKNLKLIKITTADEMFTESINYFNDADVFIMSAAVADYRPKTIATEKIKKKEASLTIELEPTTDILKHLGKHKKNQTLIGFALETNDEEVNATKKLLSKNLDFIVLNSLKNKGTCFGGDDNQITIIEKSKSTDFSIKPKIEVARDIVDYLNKKINEKFN